MKLPRFYGEINAGSINRPRLSCDWMDTRNYEIALSWGNGNSDPVWLLAVDLTIPEPIGRVADRWYNRQR